MFWILVIFCVFCLTLIPFNFGKPSPREQLDATDKFHEFKAWIAKKEARKKANLPYLYLKKHIESLPDGHSLEFLDGQQTVTVTRQGNEVVICHPLGGQAGRELALIILNAK